MAHPGDSTKGDTVKRYPLPHTNLHISRIAYGCMNLSSWNHEPVTEAEKEAAVEVILSAYEAGINLFDHADIYAYGKAESAFAAVWRELPRDKIVLQSKCGIILADDPRYEGPGRYDSSYEHIVHAVEGSLSRLQTDYLDILLLHRPDPLLEPAAVARAFSDLAHAGKVHHFGVSNHSAAQIALLRQHLEQPLVVNQLEVSVLHPYLFESGVMVNIPDGETARVGGLLDYCRQHDILVQAWSPVAGGRLFDPVADAPAAREVADLIARLAAEKGTTKEAIALSWLLRHPAGIQPIIGTTRPERVEASVRADDVELSREEWYALFIAGRGAALP